MLHDPPKLRICLGRGQVVFVIPIGKNINQKMPLAKLIETHSRPDGIVQVETLKTEHKVLKQEIEHEILLEQDVETNHDVWSSRLRNKIQDEKKQEPIEEKKNEKPAPAFIPNDPSTPTIRTTRVGRQICQPNKSFKTFAMGALTLLTMISGDVIKSTPNTTAYKSLG